MNTRIINEHVKFIGHIRQNGWMKDEFKMYGINLIFSYYNESSDRTYYNYQYKIIPWMNVDTEEFLYFIPPEKSQWKIYTKKHRTYRHYWGMLPIW